MAKRKIVSQRLRDRFRPEDHLDSQPTHSLIDVIQVPDNTAAPWRQILWRLSIAFFALTAAVFIVYFERDGYVDSAHPNGGISLLDCIYYATVTLTTTGYGDITPVTEHARLMNVLVITPLRLIFLIVLVGTTLAVLTDRSRKTIRIQRWRSNLRNHTVVVGYGTKGKSSVAAMLADDVPASEIVVVDTDPKALASARTKNLVTVEGTATKSDILKLAGVPHARAIIVATNMDDTAVLVTLSARELAPKAKIVASIRESENARLLEQSGADSVVVSAETTGRLLGLATVTPSVVEMIEDLLSPEDGFSVAERAVKDHEVGASPTHLSDVVIGVVRDGSLSKVNDGEIDELRSTDRILYIHLNQSDDA